MQHNQHAQLAAKNRGGTAKAPHLFANNRGQTTILAWTNSKNRINRGLSPIIPPNQPQIRALAIWRVDAAYV